MRKAGSVSSRTIRLDTKGLESQEAEGSMQELWEAYIHKGDAESRAELIIHMLPFVKSVAERLATRLPPHVGLDDLTSAGIIGLIDAIEKYNPSQETDFRSYAEFRIKGAVLDALRSMDWVPRSVRAKARVLESAFAMLEQKLERSPSEVEVAEFLDVTLDQLHKMLQDVSGLAFLSLDELLWREKIDREAGANADLKQFLKDPGAENALDQLELQETRAILAKTIESLPEQERLVVTLYYYEELTMKEVGRVLEISESRVCQIHSSAILRMRVRLRWMRDENMTATSLVV